MQPKWCISMGACASSGGVFDVYSMVQGIDTIVPVDVYIPGCPPRPEGLIYGLMMVQEKIRGESLANHAALRAEDPLAVGRPRADDDEVADLTGPFGNSTHQNRVSGLVETDAIGRPRIDSPEDLRPPAPRPPPGERQMTGEPSSGGPFSGFDLVAAGPGVSREGSGEAPARDSVPPGNPSVTALRRPVPRRGVPNEICAGDEDVVYVDPERITEILGWLHDDPDQHYDHLADVTAVDYGGGRPLQVVYQLWSIPHRAALRVKCELPPGRARDRERHGNLVGADWLEREVYDLFGISFAGHPDLRRILMPENYAEGHPLRKDFPLRGRFSRAEQTRRALTQGPGGLLRAG